jgi:putative nucleotidyltransferase with HDIG domain
MAIEYTEVMIPVSELQLGMHVVRLDRPWTETDFLMQGFIVDNNDVIDALISQCEFVYIQGKSLFQDEHTQHSIPRPRKQKKGFFSRKEPAPNSVNTKHQVVMSRPPQGKKRISYINKIPTEQALPQAKADYSSAKMTVNSIMDGIRIGRMIDMNEARVTVNHIVDGILQNKDALAWLTKIKDKDEYTAEHSLNVSILSATFARHLGHDENDIKKIALGGLLHDVGKAKIPIEILNKEGRFTDEEFDIMKQHTVFGRNLLMSMPKRDHFVIDIAHSHHERMDGQGYPRKLDASKIPYFAKIVAIVDAYDAITSSRCYDKGRASMEALDIIYKCKDTQFDAELALEFIKCIGIYPPGAIVELTNGEVGIVIETHEKNKLKPRILLVLDQVKKICPQKIINLNMNIKDEAGEYLRITKELVNGSHGIWLEEFIKRGLLLSQ